MSASLVGSEMCIRDSPFVCERVIEAGVTVGACPLGAVPGHVVLKIHAVSYTHLTLPTICSV
eukprot:1353955-Alexandrium_andersonii.AAC.1